MIECGLNNDVRIANFCARLFEQRPRANPFATSDGYSMVEAAGECASALKKMIYAVRSCKLSAKNMDIVMRQTDDDEQRLARELVDMVHVDDADTDVDRTGSGETAGRR